MTDNPNAAALAYVRHVLQHEDLSPSALAKRAGISSTTLTRPLNDPDHKFTISMSTINRIASATGISPGPFFDISDPVSRQHAVLSSMPRKWGGAEGMQSRGVLQIIGIIDLNEWYPNEVSLLAAYHPMFITHTWFEPQDIFGVIAKGQSADMVALHEEVLMCVRLSALKRSPSAFQLLVVQRTSLDGRLVQLSVCYMEEVGSEIVLRPASSEAAKVEALHIMGFDDPGPGIRILGVVEYVVRRAIPLG